MKPKPRHSCARDLRYSVRMPATSAPFAPSSPTVDRSLANARHPALARFVRERAITFGNFTLASGRTSTYYCDAKQITFSGEGLALVMDALAKELRDVEFDAIGGMDMGATPLAAAAALRFHQLGRGVPAFVVRKDVKEHGTRKDIEGTLPATPAKVVILDDVITTAGSIIKAVDVVRAKGHEIVLALGILDREAGGVEALRAKGVKYQPLVTISELGISNG